MCVPAAVRYGGGPVTERVLMTRSGPLGRSVWLPATNLNFHQSGGCHNGSASMFCAPGEFRTSSQDAWLDKIADSRCFMGATQFRYWQRTQFMIDVVKGRGSGFSLEAPDGVCFRTRSRQFADENVKALAVGGVGSFSRPWRMRSVLTR
jgi:uncharacterized protein (DUF779 family)